MQKYEPNDEEIGNQEAAAILGIDVPRLYEPGLHAALQPRHVPYGNGFRFRRRYLKSRVEALAAERAGLARTRASRDACTREISKLAGRRSRP